MFHSSSFWASDRFRRSSFFAEVKRPADESQKNIMDKKWKEGCL